MFPLNLHRNIAQLDRQISLLEDEYKGIEVQKKRRSQILEPSYSSCSKNSNVRMKAPTVRVTVKKTDNSSKRSKKQTPPVSSRLQSSGSLPSHCCKPWCENGDASVERKSRARGLNIKAPLHSCQALRSPQTNSMRENKCGKCLYYNEASELENDEHFDGKKKDHVLLFPNAGGTIEVTVTQKPNSGKENSPIGYKSPTRKTVSSEMDIENDLDGCKCQIKGQKWSQILCEDSSKKRQTNSENFLKNKIHSDETKTIYQPLNFKNKRKVEDNSYKSQNNPNVTNKEETFELPVKLPTQLCKTKAQSEIKSTRFEKEIQCLLENCDCGESAKDLKDPVKIFKLLINQFQQLSDKDSKKSPVYSEINKVEDTEVETSEMNKKTSTSSETAPNNITYINTVKHHFENLIKEKLLLTEGLATRDNAIAAMRKREEEYLSLIASMKSSLEKTKENAQEGIEAVKQMNIIKSKLSEQMKVSETLKDKLTKLREEARGYSLENDKLRTQIKILQLEAQKHEILMAGKEAEIKRYREEIQNFQRQIKDHLTSLKSNAQEVDMGKMIEVIMQQSQIFTQTDLDSVIEKDEKDLSRTQNGLIHSSPTSGKTSVLNSSWKEISSIHEHEQSKANSDVIYLNDENGKNFFQMFGGNSCSDTESPEKAKKPSAEKLLEKREVKNSSSFTSCISAHESRETIKSTSRNSLISAGASISVEETTVEQAKKNSGALSDKAQSNIDELLKNMKLKFSKEIFDTSFPSCTTGDYLDISQISSISPL